jgi:hypothetical protein
MIPCDAEADVVFFVGAPMRLLWTRYGQSVSPSRVASSVSNPNPITIFAKIHKRQETVTARVTVNRGADWLVSCCIEEHFLSIHKVFGTAVQCIGRAAAEASNHIILTLTPTNLANLTTENSI